MDITTEAFVLKCYDLKESDKIITLYTWDLGKIQAVVKGIRKAKSKLAAAMEPFNHIDLTLYRKSQNKLFTITQAKINQSLYKIKEDFSRIVYGDYLLELVDKLTEVEERNIELFNLLKSFLFLMEYKKPEVVLWCFKVRFLKLIGYQMCLDVCALCGQEVQPFKKGDDWKIWFSPKEGGILCYKCREICSYKKDISPGAIMVFKKLLEINLEKIDCLKFSNKMREEVGNSLQYFLAYHLSGELKTQQFIGKVDRYKMCSRGVWG